MRQRRSRAAEIVAATGSDRKLPAGISKPKQRRSHARIIVLIVLIIVVLIGSAGYAFVNGTQSAEGSSRAKVHFAVQPGDTTASVASRLEHDGIIHGSLFFSATQLFGIVGRLDGLASHLQPGTFVLRRNMSMNQIVTALKGLPQLTSFTVIPGQRVEQIAATLRRAGLNGKHFLHAVRHPHSPLPLGMDVGWPKKHTFEGFLYPDTYTVEPGSSGAYLAAVMVNRFAALFTKHMRTVARREGRSIYQIAIMASIIQREDFIPSQKRTIASVYWNRLALPVGADGGVGDLLQTDPTVSYALGHPGDWWPPTPADRSTVDSPFNTYLHTKLPPAPIAEPDLGSLRAALHPSHTNYYYFATKPGDTSGRLYFASNAQQFCAIIETC